ncbi:MAG: alpha,alpha-trehalose synthase [Ktedonobacterales bacterium]|jgi:trehalose synthase|nr:MAG: alpha,alpha-trehalose synthase [Ktedonobacterales bacterium]
MQDIRTPGMQNVVLSSKSLTDYAPVVGDDVIAELERLAKPLQGARVLHISSTAYGGGVAEMLHTLIPLMRNVGLNAEWRIISGNDEFFTVTKSMHNALQGMDLDLTPAMKATYLHANVDNAVYFEDDFDYVIVHDPQPAPLRMMCSTNSGKWIWRCHIDLTAADADYWGFLRPFVQMYDAAIFTLPDYVKRDLKIGKIAIIPPAIDPLSPKNAPMSNDDARRIVGMYGIDPDRPSLVQVSRFDPWKDPLGVIDVYRIVREQFPGLQLVMVGSMASDDPEGMEYYQRTKDHAADDPDIHLLSNLDGVGNVEVNAFQQMATVVLQKSLREGFGLTVSEGLWKGKPVIGGNVGGIPLQIQDGVTGYLVDSIEECARRTIELMRHPEQAVAMGQRGREEVRHKFLSTANLRNYLTLFNELAGNAVAPSQAESQAHALTTPA